MYILIYTSIYVYITVIYIYIWICTLIYKNQPSSLDCYFWAEYFFWGCARGGRIFVGKTELKLENQVSGIRKAYRHSTRAYLVDGSWDLQIMKPWGWMAALIKSKTNFKKKFNNVHLGAVLLPNQPSSLGCYFWATYRPPPGPTAAAVAQGGAGAL